MASNDLQVEQRYQSVVPLGTEFLAIHPGHQTFYLVASAESPEFDGWVQALRGQQRLLLDREGQPVRHFPEALVFRITATRRLESTVARPVAIDSSLAADDLIRQLNFKLKVFHGLRSRTIAPDSVEMIGMPGDVPYDERIYRVSFFLGEVSLDERVLLEVFMPGGERICRFHLDLM